MGGHVGFGGADIVGVAHDPYLQLRILLQQFGDFFQRRLGLGLDVGLSNVKQDARHFDVATLGEAILKSVRIGSDILLHGLFFDNDEHVFRATASREFKPLFFAALGEADGQAVGRSLIQDLSARLEGCRR